MSYTRIAGIFDFGCEYTTPNLSACTGMAEPDRTACIKLENAQWPSRLAACQRNNMLLVGGGAAALLLLFLVLR
jgi:hypothetical protein